MSYMRDGHQVSIDDLMPAPLDGMPADAWVSHDECSPEARPDQDTMVIRYDGTERMLSVSVTSEQLGVSVEQYRDEVAALVSCGWLILLDDGTYRFADEAMAE